MYLQQNPKSNVNRLNSYSPFQILTNVCSAFPHPHLSSLVMIPLEPCTQSVGNKFSDRFEQSLNCSRSLNALVKPADDWKWKTPWALRSAGTSHDSESKDVTVSLSMNDAYPGKI